MTERQMSATLGWLGGSSDWNQSEILNETR